MDKVMVISEEKVWIIVSKDRKMVAKGVPRNRQLVEISSKSRARFLTYKSKGAAESGFKNNWFYGAGDYKPSDMEAIEVVMRLEEV